MLIDALRELAGLDALAEADLGTRQNRHQPLRELGAMAYAVLVAATRRLLGPEAADALAPGPYVLPGGPVTDVRQVAGRGAPAAVDVRRATRPRLARGRGGRARHRGGCRRRRASRPGGPPRAWRRRRPQRALRRAGEPEHDLEPAAGGVPGLDAAARAPRRPARRSPGPGRCPPGRGSARRARSGRRRRAARRRPPRGRGRGPQLAAARPRPRLAAGGLCLAALSSRLFTARPRRSGAARTSAGSRPAFQVARGWWRRARSSGLGDDLVEAHRPARRRSPRRRPRARAP